MYTILTSFPKTGCGNVGDELIEVAVKQIFKKELGEEDFLVFFREDDVTEHIERINKTKGVLLNAFPIRDLPIYPGVYKLTDRLEDIIVPLIPIGSNYNVYPGDYYDRITLSYSKETVDFLKHVSDQNEVISVREYLTEQVLNRHGISNTLMTGCPSFYDFNYMGKKMSRPSNVRKVVFTPPMSYCYKDQAIKVMDTIAKIFKNAEKICCFICGDSKTTPLCDNMVSDNSAAMNPEVALKNMAIRKHGEELGFKTVLASHDIRRIDFFDECDLHIGYDCHGALSFIRRRKPSVMIAEDARGTGFIYTLSLPEFFGYKRLKYQPQEKPTNTSGYCDSDELFLIADADMTLPDRLEAFLTEQIACNFRRYMGVADIIEDTYHSSMKPFIKSLK